MRFQLLLVLIAAAHAPHAAFARHFWQTYGATAPYPGGAGCSWNLNSDYFVPRTCETGGYDLFSPCKTVHRVAPACKSLHPVYAGYCTPFGPSHYRHKDHVYRKYCGCTPLKHAYGPWHLDKCRKHGWAGCGAKHCGGGCAMATCGGAGAGACGGYLYGGYAADAGWAASNAGPFHNLEPIGGETLGTIDAIPAGIEGGPGAAGLPIPVQIPSAGAAGLPGLTGLTGS